MASTMAAINPRSVTALNVERRTAVRNRLMTVLQWPDTPRTVGDGSQPKRFANGRTFLHPHQASQMAGPSDHSNAGSCSRSFRKQEQGERPRPREASGTLYHEPARTATANSDEANG